MCAEKIGFKKYVFVHKYIKKVKLIIGYMRYPKRPIGLKNLDNQITEIIYVKSKGKVARKFTIPFFFCNREQKENS